MLEAILRYLNNWFIGKIIEGEYEIKDGTIAIDAKSGQYVRIVGSALNDGVYQLPLHDLKAETFNGEIWELLVPQAIIDTELSVSAWVKDNTPSQFTSESFGGYSYSKATKDGKPIGWQDVFADELKPYKKVMNS